MGQNPITYIALLRGINVGGNNIIKMQDLRRVLGELGLSGVKTYIQSGNVVFQSAEGADRLKTLMEKSIIASFGIASSVMLRTREEWTAIMADCPFDSDALAEGESLSVSMLLTEPTPEELAELPEWNGVDEYSIRGREIYQLYRQRMSDSKLPQHLQRLRIPATNRNWRTMNKLAEMAAEAEA